MFQKKHRRALITSGAILLALLMVIGIVALVRSLDSGSGEEDPYTPGAASTSQTDAASADTAEPEAPSTEEATPSEDTTAQQPALDPATVSTVNVDPMELAVSYVKGIGGFEYAIERTASGTQYVEFRSPSLAGTKCTDDMGLFASILEGPDGEESSAITKTTQVDGIKYGLSLAADNCTKDPALLKQYQASFSDAFGLLKKME